MLIKDIKRFCDSILLTESMSIRDFKSEIKDRYSSDLSSMSVVLNYFKQDNELKKLISLNDYIDVPFSLIVDISKFYKDKYQKQILSKSFNIVTETDDWVLVTPFSLEASYFLAHKYLRQKGDEDSFGSGPTWCIAKQGDDYYWKKYTGGKDYPIVYYIISKKKSKDRFAIVFNNLNQNQNENHKDIEFSKENFEKNIPISKMNGEIRDFAQIMSRNRVIELLKEKFNIYLDISIKSKKKGVYNLSKIIYDNFDNTLDTSQKIEEIEDKNKDIKKLGEYFTEKQPSLSSSFIQLHKCVESVKNKYGLKIKKDYHPLTFDILSKCISHWNVNGWDYISDPIVSIIESKEDIDAFYSLILMLFLMCEENPSFIFQSFKRVLSIVDVDESLRNVYLDNYKSNIVKNRYSKLLTAARESFESSSEVKKLFYDVLKMSKNRVFGLTCPMEYFYSLDISLKKYKRGFSKNDLYDMYDTLSQYSLIQRINFLMKIDNVEKFADFVVKNYIIDEKGNISKLSSDGYVIDFVLDGKNIDDFYKDNFI